MPDLFIISTQWNYWTIEACVKSFLIDSLSIWAIICIFICTQKINHWRHWSLFPSHIITMPLLLCVSDICDSSAIALENKVFAFPPSADWRIKIREKSCNFSFPFHSMCLISLNIDDRLELNAGILVITHMRCANSIKQQTEEDEEEKWHEWERERERAIETER